MKEKIILKEFKEWIEKTNYTYNNEVIFRNTGNTVMAYVQSSGDMCELNTVAGDILELLSKNITLKEIVYEKIPEMYDVNINEVYEDIYYILKRFIEIKIIEVK